MPDEPTKFILGDAAVDATTTRRKRRFFAKKQPPPPLMQCENCGTALTGEYCSECGQHAIDYRRSVWRVTIDALDSFLNWDTKFLNSVGVLLTRPGKLTNDFNAGRRMRYVHPLRLYLLASIAFFLIAKLVNFGDGVSIDLTTEDRAAIQRAISKVTAPDSPFTPEQRERVEAARALWTDEAAGLDEKQRAKLERAMQRLQRFADREQFKPQDGQKLEEALKRIESATKKPRAASPPPSTEGAPVPPEAPGVVVPPVGGPTPGTGSRIKFGSDGHTAQSPFEKWLETRLKDKIGEDGTKAQLFFDTLRSNIPTMMLVCVPLFAFVLKLLYIRQRRYYVEHLVYALHIHTFAYVAVVVITLLSIAAARVLPAVQGPLVFVLSLVGVAQVFLSIRRVYGQGWFMTTLKFVLGSWIYLFVLAFGVAATAFITLALP